MKLNIQLFGGGTKWSAGITESAIDQAYKDFCARIALTENAIKSYSAVDEALKNGWSGKDRDDYIAKYHAHADSVIAQIEEYRLAVGKAIEDLKANWTNFQNGLIK
jgi:hypothetical protein